MRVTAGRGTAQLRPDPGRVIARVFLPGEELPHLKSRAGAVVQRVLALTEEQCEQLLAGILADFAGRHRDFEGVLAAHASVVSSHLGHSVDLTPARTLLLGASFTAEFAVEGAALCNPSAVLHPDQGSLQPGQARVAISLRGVGEGHISSVGFATAVAGPGDAWSFDPRPMPAVAAVTTAGRLHPEHVRAVLADQGCTDELANSVLGAVPSEFGGPDLERALAATPPDLVLRPEAQATTDLLRRVVSSAYGAAFPPDVTLGQQVLLPVVAEERNGMEDARFVRFVEDDGSVDYRGTYTAYDGQQITCRLLTSPDLRVFQAYRLAGPAAANKGMALFPRRIRGRYVSLCRTDGETTCLTWSPDGYVWSDAVPVQSPSSPWELLQVGNCGSPIETDRGWLVLTHGVGPMRRYAIGAILLDLDRPSELIGGLDHPLLQAAADEQEGYVPNVVYSCGGIVHDGLLWLPYGIGDARIGIASIPVDKLLDELLHGSAAR